MTFLQIKFRCLVEQKGKFVGQSSWTSPINVEWSPRDSEIKIKNSNLTEINSTSIIVGDEVVLECSSRSNPESESEWLIEQDNTTMALLPHWENQGNIRNSYACKPIYSS